MSAIVIAVTNIITGFVGGDDRYCMVDETCLLDTETGFKFFLYPDSFKITKDDELVASSNDFKPEDQRIFLKLKEALYTKYAPVKEKRIQDFLAPYKSTA